jgi:uncharacterized protein (DUF433 family)
MGIGSLIESTPGICGGRPHITGTRVPVHRVAGYYRLGYSPEEIREFLTSLSLPQIYAALAHALANPEETEQSLRNEEVAIGQLTSSLNMPASFSFTNNDGV